MKTIDADARMTNQEAIYKLKCLLSMCEFKDAYSNYIDRDEYDEAVDIAIKALKQPEIIRCKDCKHHDTYPEDSDNDMPLKCLGIRYGGVMEDWFCERGGKENR